MPAPQEPVQLQAWIRRVFAGAAKMSPGCSVRWRVGVGFFFAWLVLLEVLGGWGGWALGFSCFSFFWGGDLVVVEEVEGVDMFSAVRLVLDRVVLDVIVDGSQHFFFFGGFSFLLKSVTN